MKKESKFKNDGTCVFLRYLPENITEEQLKNAVDFCTCCEIRGQYNWNRAAFMSFPSLQLAYEAKQKLHEMKLGENYLHADIKRSREEIMKERKQWKVTAKYDYNNRKSARKSADRRAFLRNLKEKFNLRDVEEEDLMEDDDI